MSKRKEDNSDDCNFECKETKFTKFLSGIKRPKFFIDKYQDQEFIGNVKVVFVQTPTWAYWEKSIGSAFVVLAFFTIGAMAILIFFYSLSFALDKMTSLHIILFTAGVLMPAAFLTMSSFNGSSSFLNPRHRKLDYIVIKLFSILCVIAGVVVLIRSSNMRLLDRVWSLKFWTPHAVTGAVAVVLCISDLLILTCVSAEKATDIREGTWFKYALPVNIPSYATSSVCFILSLYKTGFVKWLPLPDIQYFLLFFCLYNTFFAIITAIRALRCNSIQRRLHMYK